MPLHFAMTIDIVTIHVELDSLQTIKTKTQIYSSFLNLTIMHHCKDIWSTSSLRKCIETSSTQSEVDVMMCTTFHTLHDIAFHMVFHKERTFPEDHKFQQSIQRLGIVNITKVGSIKGEVIYTFSHPTFLEYFAALHLITLPQEEQFASIRKSIVDEDSFGLRSEVWPFFFGLLHDFYPTRTS